MTTSDKFWIFTTIIGIVTTYNWFGKWAPVWYSLGALIALFIAQ